MCCHVSSELLPLQIQSEDHFSFSLPSKYFCQKFPPFLTSLSLFSFSSDRLMVMVVVWVANGFCVGVVATFGLVWRRLEGDDSCGRWIVVGWVLIPGSFRSLMTLGRGSWRLILAGLGLNRCWLGLNRWWVLLWCGFYFGVGFALIGCWLGLNW